MTLDEFDFIEFDLTWSTIAFIGLQW